MVDLIPFLIFSVHHLGEKPFKCPTCEECFKNSAKLARHKEIVHEKKKYYCPVCGVEYTCRRSMKKHALKNHGVEYKHKRKNAHGSTAKTRDQGYIY